ncbi:MAG: hypothetical protein IKQ36_08875 [Clostridia bacterium]|nr:hypothetical protein [Clostridia bacterium]
MDGFSFKRLLRRPWLSILSFIIAGALCTLLCLLSNYLDAQRANLDSLRENYGVKCVVTDKRGTKSTSLCLAKRYTDFIRDEENGLGSFIKELLLTKEFAGSGYIGSVTVLGVSSPRCDEALDPAMGGSYYTEEEDFFLLDEPVCLVPKEDYDDYSGGELALALKDRYGENDGLGEGTRKFRVVGWYGGSGKVFIPYPYAFSTGASLSEHPSTDSVAFILRDNESKAALMEAAAPMFTEVDPSSVNYGFAINVNDEQYKATVSAVKQDISRTELLLPLLSLLSLGAGFLVGFLGTRGETKNYALMRTLGAARSKLMLTVLLEQQLPPLIASVAAGAAAGKPLTALMFFAFNTVGCFASAARQVMTPPTRLLRDSEQ